ncbi:MAG: hypothetical protein ACXWC9_07325 [Pseudobdellovibrionaceae bacterium]
MKKLRLLKRSIVCLILAIILGLALSGNAYAKGSVSRARRAVTQAPRASTSLQTSPEQATGTAQKSPGVEGTWNLALSQRQSQSQFNQHQLTEFRLLANLKYEPLQNIYFSLGPKFVYTNGFLQTQDAQNANRSEWGLREASIRGQFDWFQIGLGALDQSVQHPSVLLHDQTFPAVELRAHSDLQSHWIFAAQVETGIPTTSSLSTQARDFEKTPSYSSGSISIEAQRMLVDMKMRAGIFEFQDLPMSVASKSSLLGNTAVTSNGSDSQFVYEYQGSFADLMGKVNITNRFAIGASTEWVKNSKAESNLGQGNISRIFSDIRATKIFDISPYYEYFRIEPDATVALYNADTLNTNRAGYRGGLSVTYKQTLKVSFSSGERDVIYSSPFQQREKTLNLRLETLDVSI